MTTTDGFKQFWHSRTARGTVLAGIVLMVSIALVLMFLLAQATNSAVYERNYQHLLVANAVAVALLCLVLLWLALRLWRGLRRGKFGSRLLLKLALVFVLVASVPGSLLYLVAYQFVSRSIESWFDVKVERALSAGLSLGQSVLDTLKADAASKSQAAAYALATQPAFDMGLALDRLRSQQNADRLVLWSQSGQQIAAAFQSSFSASTQPPSAEVLEQLKEQAVVSYVEGLEEVGEQQEAAAQGEQPELAGSVSIVAYTLVRPVQFGLHTDAWVLQSVQQVPPDLLQNAVLVQNANREYQERALARVGMQRMFIGTLTLTLFLAVFGAVLLAALISAQLARPLLLLAAGVRQVAEGDLRPKHIHDARDELGGLTRSFAQMTQQLADARQAASSSLADLDASRAELQTILDNLTSGVLVLHPDGTILSANPGAGRILRLPQADLPGQQLGQIDGLQQMGETVQQQFEALVGSDVRPSGGAELVHVVTAPADVSTQAVIDADGVDAADGTDSASHSETEAEAEENNHAANGHANYWQHSMELNPPAHEGLQQEAITLVLRGALLPESDVPGARLLVFEDISAEVSAQRAQAWSEVARRLAHEIKNPLTPIQLSAERLAQQLRQVIHNLLQNAQDAQQQANRQTDEPVLIQTQWRPAAQRVRLTVSDAGAGFPEHILQRAFEPYVTTKAKGTGLGLPMVKKIADEHGARITISNRMQDGEVVGAQVSLLIPAAAQPENAAGVANAANTGNAVDAANGHSQA